MSLYYIKYFTSPLHQDLDQQVTDYLPTLVDLFRSEEALLGSELATISAFETRSPEAPAAVHFEGGAKGEKDNLPGE